MEASLSQILIVTSILACGSLIQGIVGFAAGLFAIPLLVIAGVDLPSAVTIILVATSAQNAVGAYHLRHDIEYRKTIRPSIIRLIALPAGTLLMLAVTSIDRDMVKQLVGGVLLLIVAVDVLWRTEPRKDIAAGWDYLAFTLSGLIAGLCGMGGPPMVLWVTAHDWSSQKSRGFLFFVFLIGIPPQLIALRLLFPSVFWSGVLYGSMTLPVVLAGTVIGLRVGNRLSRSKLRRLTYAVLTVVAIIAIAEPYS